MTLQQFVSMLIISVMFLIAGCHGHDHSHDHDHSDDHSHTHDEVHRFTHWEGNLELFARFGLHENSGRIEGELFVSEEHHPVNELTGEIRFLENENVAASQELKRSRDGLFPFELFFQNSDEPVLSVSMRLQGDEFNINLGTVNRYAGHPGEPDAQEIVELDKPMQWRLSITSDFAGDADIPETVSGYGTVRYDPGNYLEITSPVDGHIDSENITMIPASGTRVQAGDRLLSISPPLSSENTWLDYRLAYRQAEEAFERARRLIENDAISLREYQEREREYIVRKNGYEHFTSDSRHGVEIQDEDSQLYLSAIQSGFIAESFLTAGREIEMGDPLFTIFDPSRLWVEVLAYRDELQHMPNITGAEILTGRNERVTLNNSQIRLVSRDLRSDESGNRSKITLAVDNSGNMLSPNQPVRVKLKGDEGRSVMAVPNEAIFDNESYKVVFVVHSGDQFERRIVQTGNSYGGYTAITWGLEAGERIVTQGIYTLHLMTGNVQIDDDHDH
jgi:membrane fusion protein, heavy metal efflux system